MPSTAPWLNVRDFGAKGDGKNDDFAAFRAAIDSFPAYGGGRITVPPGMYLLSKTLHLNRQVILEGAGGSVWSYVTTLLFPDGVIGIVVEHPSNKDDPSRGDFSRICDLGILSQGKSVPGAHGVYMKGAARVTDCWIRGFSDNGVNIVADSQDKPSTGANQWVLSRVWIDESGGHGVYIAGGDTNAGLCEMVSVVTNGGYGICDRSFLGNTYLACMSATNQLGPYYAAAAHNARGLFLGCYSEGDQGPSYMAFPALAVGGFIGGFTKDSAPMIIGGGKLYNLVPARAPEPFAGPYTVVPSAEPPFKKPASGPMVTPRWPAGRTYRLAGGSVTLSGSIRLPEAPFRGSTLRNGNPRLYSLADGRIMAATRALPDPELANYCFSSDGGLTWTTPPQPVPYFRGAVQLTNGDLIFPARKIGKATDHCILPKGASVMTVSAGGVSIPDTHEGGILDGVAATLDGGWIGTLQSNNVLFCLKSSNGLTWNDLSVVSKNAEDGSALVRLADRSLLCLFVSGKMIRSSRSRDEGATWSAPGVVARGSAPPSAVVLGDRTLAAGVGDPGVRLMWDRKGAGGTFASIDIAAHHNASSTAALDVDASGNLLTTGYTGLAVTGPRSVLLAYDNEAAASYVVLVTFEAPDQPR